jgi:tetratricopeptide (TPR) repeat protein
MAYGKDNKHLFEKGMKAFAENRYQESEEYFTQVLEGEPGFRMAWESRGAARLRLERTESAIEDFTKAIELAPDKSRPYHMRGLALERRGAWEEAISDFDRAISLDREYVAAYHSRSLLRLRRGEEALAEEDLQTFKHLTEKRLEEFGNEHNILRSAHMAVEEAGYADVMVDR